MRLLILLGYDTSLERSQEESIRKQIQFARKRLNSTSSSLLTVKHYDGVIFIDESLRVGDEVSVSDVWECAEYPELEEFATTGTVARAKEKDPLSVSMPFRNSELGVLTVIASYSAIGMPVSINKLADIVYGLDGEVDGKDLVRTHKYRINKTLKKSNVPWNIESKKGNYYLSPKVEKVQLQS